MAEFPALPLWTDAYLADTTHLTAIEHGAFLLLLMTAWRSKTCDLPDDDKLLARYARVTAGQWRRIRPTLERLHRIENGRWSNDRLLDEREVVRRQVQQRSDAGRANALKRWNRGLAAAPRAHNEKIAPTPTPRTTPIKEDSPTENLSTCVDAWNALAEDIGLPRVCPPISEARRRKLRARIAEIGPAGWSRALAKVRDSPLCRGENDRGWVANFDFLLQPSSMAKLLEGNYDRRQPKRPGTLDTGKILEEMARRETRGHHPQGGDGGNAHALPAPAPCPDRGGGGDLPDRPDRESGRVRPNGSGNGSGLAPVQGGVEAHDLADAGRSLPGAGGAPRKADREDSA